MPRNTKRAFNVAPVYKGQRGHPVLLDKAYWREMLDLPAEAMPRAVIQGAREKLRLVEVDEKGVVMDIDTREAYQRALGTGVLNLTHTNHGSQTTSPHLATARIQAMAQRLPEQDDQRFPAQDDNRNRNALDQHLDQRMRLKQQPAASDIKQQRQSQRQRLRKEIQADADKHRVAPVSDRSCWKIAR